LQPNARREELFGLTKTIENSELLEIKSSHLGITSRSEDTPSYAPLLAKRASQPSIKEEDMIVETASTSVIAEPMDSGNFKTESQITSAFAKVSKTTDLETVAKVEPENTHLARIVNVEQLPAGTITPCTPVLTKPPPLVKIHSIELNSSTTGSQSTPSSSSHGSALSIPKWGSPQSVPQDLSMANRNEGFVEATSDSIASLNSGTTTSSVSRAPIIVSTKNVVAPSNKSTTVELSSSAEATMGRSVSKSVIVCHRQGSSLNVSFLCFVLIYFYYKWLLLS